MKYVFPVVVLVIVCLSGGCGGGKSTTNPNTTFATAYLPFVEDVVFPAEIYAGEPFEIVLKLSAVRDPDMLRGITVQTMSQWSSVPDSPTATGMVLNTWCWRDVGIQGNQLATELHWPLPERAVGTYTVDVISAETRLWGGISDEFMVTPTMGTPYSEHQETREYEFTVLPSPD